MGLVCDGFEHTKRKKSIKEIDFHVLAYLEKNSFGRYLRRSISSRSGLRLPPSKSQVEEEVAHYSLEVRASPEMSRRRRKFARKAAAANCFQKNQKRDFDFRNGIEQN